MGFGNSDILEKRKRCDQKRQRYLQAFALLIQGGCKAKDFSNRLDELLCPRLSSNHVVIRDNARLHKTPYTRELTEATRAELMFLPLIHPIIIRLNMILLISDESRSITLKSPLRMLFTCISVSKIYHKYLCETFETA